ncbi:conserved membrane hypothetical protein [Vibrio crassostreae]|uniref:hypothetical protein n=2 Tax=Vibrio crassostreae TaxID=246167 RepID=UPI00063619EE|nr:hypothetical protein [Vibrio crassostreae]CAK1910911.1 conserved membrane hypothetical protein [Vibrio crassostreae]CAK1921111.1 conserved membrane hypothetical protein [Vibrio crassostreae]CAK1930882.1 conserved membrane hypothetical protein [Vibrio crassostreae]CAK1932892.1 conserved membrane hypothetical protein [Vibrio crassostreae]CAK1938445.1 conserved membrane hypothetical protein [Vibrio crassostreae]
MSRFESAKREVIAILLPIAVLIVIKLFKGDFWDIFTMSDFSLATSIMYGQLLAKTFDVQDSKKKADMFSSFQLKIFCLAIISITMYACFQILDTVPMLMYVVQALVLMVSIYCYLPYSTLLDDMRKK